MLIKNSKIKEFAFLIALMDICVCVYVHVDKIIRCEYNNGGGGGLFTQFKKQEVN